MSKPSTQSSLAKDKPPPPTRGQRLAAFGFLGAFGLTILTVLLTGLRVGAPAARHLLQPVPPAAETTAPRVPAGAPAGSASGRRAPPAAAPSSAEEPITDEKGLRESAGHDPDDRTRKNSRPHTGEARESEVNDGR